MALKISSSKKKPTTTATETIEVKTQFPPLMDPAHFAATIGFTPDSIRSQIERGNIPTIKMGRRVCVNTAAISAQCLEGLAKLEAN